MSGRTKGCLSLLVIGALLLIAPLFWRQVIVRSYQTRVHSPVDAPVRRTAIVFGAAVYRNGRLSTVLRDRMDTAIALYKSGAVSELLVSGDGVSARYDEPSAMKAYAMQQGIPDYAIDVDLAGSRTYDSCYRARHLFNVREAILVTQSFHLSRALFVCDKLGIDAVGVNADMRHYRGARWYEFREVGATLVALRDVLRRQEPAIMTLVPALRQGTI